MSRTPPQLNPTIGESPPWLLFDPTQTNSTAVTCPTCAPHPLSNCGFQDDGPCLPAALRTKGTTPLRHRYGDSECGPVPLVRIPARTALIRGAHASRGSPPGTPCPLRSHSILPHGRCPSFSAQPSTANRFSRVNEGCGGKRLPLIRQASPVARRLAVVITESDSLSFEATGPPRAALPLRVLG